MSERILLFLMLFLGCSGIKAQEKPVQWTGVIRDEALSPMSFAHIGILKTRKGTLSDKEGKFTILAYPNDSLRFSSVGYKTLILPIPKTNSGIVLYDVIMQEDTIQLEEVIVLPWKTYKDFVDAFVEITLAKDVMQRAYKNIEIISKQIYSQLSDSYNAPPNPYASFRLSMQEQYNQMAQEGMIVPTTQLTNPMAWAELVEAIRRGDFKKKN